MAVVVIGAIITSTALATIVLPAVYTLLDDLQGLLADVPKLWQIPRLTREPSTVSATTSASLSALIDHGLVDAEEAGALARISQTGGPPNPESAVS
jgi:hypothetical protein